jgi:hypothetical protein
MGRRRVRSAIENVGCNPDTNAGVPTAHGGTVTNVSGIFSILPARRPFAEVRNRRFPKARWRSDSLCLLLEERGQR